MPRRKKTNDNNLVLGLSAAGGKDAVLYRGIFSDSYIKNRLKKSADYLSPEEVQPLYDKIQKLWTDNYHGLIRRNEAYTRTTFIDPVLKLLGWEFIPETSMPQFNNIKIRGKRPDYCLLSTEEARQSAAQADDVEMFRLSATVLEAKKALHNLDDASKTETPGWFPSQQIQDYLSSARDASGNRYFDWAILSNGNEWRLYSEHAARDAYFSFRLAYGEVFCTPEDFRLFAVLFRPESFIRSTSNRCFLDDIQSEALSAQSGLEQDLRKRIFYVLEDLGTGFYNEPANNLSESDLQKVYHHSLIYLYRLLFILYAESRYLLPIKRTGVGANAHYYNNYSLARHVEKLRHKNSYSSNDDSLLYGDVTDLFILIDGADERRNKLSEVTQFNGGLFSPDIAPELDQWRIGDKDLADVLRQLIFSQPPASKRQVQQVITTDETVDYATLEVRQLGDIYEGLLGAHFEYDTPNLVLKNEKGENHSQGIFYTPDWVVTFLVRETLGPLLEQAEQNPEVQSARRAQTEESRRNDSFARAVLQLDICDPAMGSGHFLVSATEYLAEQILYHPTTRLKTEKISRAGLESRLSRTGSYRFHKDSRRSRQKSRSGVDASLNHAFTVST